MKKEQLINEFLKLLEEKNISKREQSIYLLELEDILAEIDAYKKIEPLKLEYKFKNNSYKYIAGYMGVEGAFAHEALLNYFGQDTIAKCYSNFEEVFKAIKKGEIDYGVLPFENSSTGSINDNYDLIRKYDLFIVGEYSLKIEECLLAKKGAKLEDIKKVYSHEQAIKQCKKYLDTHKIEGVNYSNTAIAARDVAKMTDNSVGAIASRLTAKLYNLDIIKEKINDSDKNQTRFIIISNNLETKEEDNRLSLLLTLKHEVGRLYQVLKVLSSYNLNMCRIESRPIIDEPWHYYFYIDIVGNIKDDNILLALAKVKELATSFKVIGSYEAHI